MAKALHFLKLSLFLSIITFSFNYTQAQEICGNSIDDDNNGLYDCADPDCNTGCNDAIACSNALYQVISGVLKQFDPLSSSYQTIGDSGMGGYNGAGYSVRDGYFYAIKKINNEQHIVRINSSGVATDVGAINNWTGITYSADIDTSGNWIAFVGGTSPQLRKIDLYSSPLNLTLDSLTNLSGGNIPNTADITYNAVTNKVYGMSSNMQLIELDIANMTADIIANYGTNKGGFGAAWSDLEGNSYFSCNATGEIYMQQFDANGAPTTLRIIGYGTITSSNDGMNCMLALPPIETDCGDGIDNDGDGLTDEEDEDCLEVPTFSKPTEPVTTAGDNAWGITFVDYDGDCDDDIWVSNYDNNQPSKLYRNDGGTFTQVSGNPVTSDISSSIAGSWADFNNDGNIDLAVVNNVGDTNFLYQNTGTSFTSVAGGDFTEDNGYAHGVSYVDYDNDGFVDIFVSEYFESKFNKLYRNNGDGTFTRQTEGILVNDPLPSIGATWADVNGDGWQDVFVPNNGVSNVLYINNGDRTFSKTVMGDNAQSVGSSFGDYDNDGDLDLFVANSSNEDNFLYKNDGNGNFTLDTNSPASQGGGNSHGSAWGDFDNDGWLDLFVTNDRDGVKFMYMNDGTGELRKVVVSSIILGDGNSFGVATSDYDNDGDLDMVIANHSGDNNFLYQNDGNSNNYINIVAHGTNSNYSAIGAKIEVTATINGQSVTQTREVSGQTGGGPGSQNSLTQHFGLGDATIIDEIKITWPSGYVQTETNVSTNQKRMITEENGSLISGTIYNDTNGNCVQDAGEMGMPNVIVELNGGESFTLTDENGYYEAYVNPGTYTIGQQIPNNYTNICPGTGQTHSVNVTSIGQTYPNNDFPNQATSALPDLCASVGTTALRRGFDNEMVISYSNYGAAPATNVILTLTTPDGITLSRADIAWDSVSGNVYTWNLGTLDINESGAINILNNVDLSSAINTNKTFTVNISSTESDLNTSCNSSSVTEKIVGAIDPNDILVSPEGFGPAHYIAPDQMLTYRIRFQNVGNYYATNIVVVDTIPQELDITTLRPSTVSHECKFEMLENNVIKWSFTDINLPDSTTNEMESHGFVQFTITPKSNLSQGTIIENQAHIKFDFEYPLATNIVKSTIDHKYEERNKNEVQLFLYPNPAVDYLNLFMYYPDTQFYKNALKESLIQKQIKIYTIQGKLVTSHYYGKSPNNHQIDISNLPEGIYIVEVTDQQNRRLIGKLVKKYRN